MTIRRTVKKVIDGDTFQTHRKVNGSNYIRIANKNAPEKHQRGGSQSTARLKKQIQGKTVTLQPVGRSYGRVVAKVRRNRRLLK
jgi:endonuclease YncB( thermonuclease family)